MNHPLRVLLVEDSEDDAKLLLLKLQSGGYEPQYLRVDTSGALRAALADGQWDVVISDFSMPQFNGLEALSVVREKGVDAPFILVSGTIGEEIAVQAMKAGANDYIMKGNLARLVPAIQRELREADVRREQHRMELELERIRRQHTSILEAAGEGICGLDLEGNITFMNTPGAAMAGWKPEELIGKSLHDVLHHSCVDGTPFPREACSLCATLYDGLVHWMDDEVFWRKDGTSFLVEYICNPIREGNNVGGAVLTFKDITKRHRELRALRESEARFMAFMDNSPVIAFIKDDESRTVWVNRPFEKFFHVKLADVLGKDDFKLWPMDVARRLRKNDQEVFISNQPTQQTESLPTPNGMMCSWLVLRFPFRDAQGHSLIGGVAMEVTESHTVNRLA